MKRTVSLLAVLALLAGCAKQTSPPEEETLFLPTEQETESEEAASDAFDIFTDERSLAVMIDNDGSDSRPQAGLEDAYLLYEMYVEGRATRIMAVFKGADTQKIGPVRSSRHYFLEYALDCDALYAHAGWSPKAMEDISNLKINNLNGLVYEPKYYWRERKFKGDYHSLYTSADNLMRLAEDLSYRTQSSSLPFDFTEEPFEIEGEKAETISFPYADFYTVTYKYNPDTKLYDRFINSDYHSTQSGTKLTAKQIIIQIASNYSLGDGTARQQLDTVGSGKGFFVREGKVEPLTWSRNARSDRLIFRKADGTPLTLGCDGATYVQVIPPAMKYTLE